jgi:imidazole glycerol-phosphate synthase subunit HisH
MSADKIVIIDYGMGNVGSIANMLKKIGREALVTSDHNLIRKADKLVLPGVGSFDYGMHNLIEGGLIPLLHEKVLVQKTPVLGICLGMQLLTKGSEEGELEGLGWIDAQTERFRFGTSPPLKVPHMGWNTVTPLKNSLLFEDMYPEPRFYFVHSYHVRCRNASDALTSTRYGFDFTSSLERGHIAGVQFHPEKSHKFGMQLLKNFAEKFGHA